MFRAFLAFAFVLTLAISGFSQPNSEKASQPPGVTPPPPASAKLVKDSLATVEASKTAKAKRKSKAKAAAEAKAVAADSAKTTEPAAVTTPAILPAVTAAPASGNPVPVTGANTGVDSIPANPVTTAAPAALAPKTADTVSAPVVESVVAKPGEFKREPQDLRLFNDPHLVGLEYGAGILGSVVAGTLCFYIGSGIETAIVGESESHKGTLKFTGIRYDNYKGAFWGGATGMVLGSALTTYFIGQTDEEDGGLLLTLMGTAAAGAGAFYIAHLAGVNDDIDWTPFIPLLAIPSMGGTLGFNVSRWFSDHAREKVVGSQSAVWLHAPGLAWGRSAAGDRLEVRALNLTF